MRIGSALFDKLVQRPLDLPQSIDLLADVVSMRNCYCSDLIAVGAAFAEPHEVSDGAQSEAEFARPADENDRVSLLCRIASIPVDAANGLGEQAYPLIVTDRLDTHTGDLGDPANRQRVIIAWAHHPPFVI